MTAPLAVEVLSVRRGGQAVLRDISFTVDGPGIHGLIGPNGAGKTTLLMTIAGLVQPSAGRVLAFGQTPAQAAPKMGLVPQAAGFDRGFPITLRGVVETALTGPGLLPRRQTQADRGRVDAALASTGTGHLAGRRLSALSAGELQRGLIARALAADPALLLLDEPTASVDQASADAIFALLRDLGRSTTILIVSHDLARIAATADRVFCLGPAFREAEPSADAARLAALIFG
ncbi:metal ABC transporter ATP-binding protein [Pseudogemmobacter sonorensis]|uniref:metal ABC transporter ATP-binding protein n=1 Tax=Pseudogemmobacter sonorensis TaxID=2989681 RepID=UPI0036A490DE